MSSLFESNFVRYCILPALGLISGFVCLYIDPKKNTKAALLIVAVLAASAIATTAVGFSDDKEKNVEKARSKQESDDLSDTRKNVALLVALLQTSKGGLLAAAKPNEVDHTRVQQAIAASVALNEETASSLSSGCEIQYFSKDIDKASVLQALQDAGFHFVKKEAQLPNDRTNAIWVGDPVPPSDAKVVALTLIRAGVQIRSIQRFRENSLHRGQCLIEIGAFPQMNENPVWTVERVEAQNGDFPRESKD